jgi:hypothetical protein
MGKLVVVAAVAGVLAVPAGAAAKTRHYFGHTTCGAGTATCPHQREEITMSRLGHSLRAFKTKVTCTFGGETQPNTLVALNNSIHVRKSGRFKYKSSDLTIKGRASAKRITGSLSFVQPPDEGDTNSCRVSGVRFTAKYKKHPLYRTGKWKGTASCEAGFSGCPEQTQVLTMRVKKGRIVNMSAELQCDQGSGGSKTVLFHIDRVPIDWYGHFQVHTDYQGSTSSFSYQALGRARGAHLSGGLEYFEGTNDNMYTCEAFPTIAASRIGP